MENNYEKYTFDEFLKDEFFLQSIYSPTSQSDMYWNDLRERGIINIEEFTRAREFLLELNETTEISPLVEERIPLIWERIQNTNQKKRRKIYLRYAIAAVGIAAIFILTFTILNWQSYSADDEGLLSGGMDILNVPKSEMSDEIRIIRSGNQLSIAGDSAVIDYSHEEKVIVNDEIIEEKSQQLEYTQLVVPYGKRSSLILADGSKIYVNAGTRLVYPVTFAKNIREIYVDGEIYADIASDKKVPFIVRTKDMDITVLGTQFNITAYENESVNRVVLVEGSVQVENKTGKKEKLKLVPNEMFYIADNEGYVEKVDVMSYISWKNGYSLFRNERLGLILERLSRYYGVAISCGPGVSDLRCSGGLDLKDDINRVLDGICQSVSVSYEKYDNTYIFSINP